MGSSQESFIVEVWFEIEKDSNGFPKSRDAEALLCKPLNPECSLCVVTSVPFYVRAVATGDTIRTEGAQAGFLQFKEVVERGGYSIYRVLLHNAGQKEQLIRTLLAFDALLEQDGNLIAIAVPPLADSDAIVDYILEGKSKGLWGAQDGYIFDA